MFPSALNFIYWTYELDLNMWLVEFLNKTLCELHELSWCFWCTEQILTSKEYYSMVIYYFIDEISIVLILNNFEIHYYL